MRIRFADIGDWRSIAGARLPLDGLIVLFGTNSSGKTSVLDTLRNALGGEDAPRGDPDVDFFDGQILFDLNLADVPGDREAELLRRLLSGQLADDQVWDVLDPGATADLRDMPIEFIRDYLADGLAARGSAGGREDRRMLASHLVAGCLFMADAQCSWLVAAAPADNTTREATTRIALAALGAHGEGVTTSAKPIWNEVDLVAHCAVALQDRGSEPVPWAPIGPAVGQFLSKADFGNPTTIGLDPETVELEVTGKVETVHDRMWEMPGMRLGSGPMTFDASTFKAARLFDAPDPWLEWRSSEGGEFTWKQPPSPSGQDAWYRVRATLVETTRLIAERANALAPSFVRDQGRIGIEILAPTQWGDRRIQVTFDEGDFVHKLSMVGAGTARWAAASIRLACEELLTGRREVLGSDGDILSDVEAIGAVVAEERRHPEAATRIRFARSDRLGMFLVDEPEAHLHPEAVRSVATWLVELADRASGVVVATHHPGLLRTPSLLTRIVRVYRMNGTTALTDVTDDVRGIADALRDAGLGAGELLLYTRLALFVEGLHDVAVLEEWAGPQLDAAGVRIFPMHGTHNLADRHDAVRPSSALLDSEVIEALGIRLGVLVDNAGIERVRAGRPITDEESRVLSFLKRARERGRPAVQPYGWSKPDIIEFLDDEICRNHAPNFPGWSLATKEWRKIRDRRPEFKSWVKERYGLSLHSEQVRTIAAECRNADRIPAEFVSRIDEIVRGASQAIDTRVP